MFHWLKLLAQNSNPVICVPQQRFPLNYDFSVFNCPLLLSLSPLQHQLSVFGCQKWNLACTSAVSFKLGQVLHSEMQILLTIIKQSDHLSYSATNNHAPVKITELTFSPFWWMMCQKLTDDWLIRKLYESVCVQVYLKSVSEWIKWTHMFSDNSSYYVVHIIYNTCRCCKQTKRLTTVYNSTCSSNDAWWRFGHCILWVGIRNGSFYFQNKKLVWMQCRTDDK